MALTTIHQHRVCTRINSKTTNRSSNHHLILKVHPSSTLASASQSTCHPRTATRAQALEPTESTQGCPAMEADPVIATMTFLRTKRVSNSNRCQAVRHQPRLPAISNRAPASGIFHLTIRTIPTSTTTPRWGTHTMDTTTSRTSSIHLTWTSSCWITTACCRTTTTTALMRPCVEHFCRVDSPLTVNPASLVQDLFNCGNSYSNSSPTNRVRISFRGPVTDGNSNWLILMR